jgi:predicted Fe-S protein YdhL (DUF1289 family)
MTNKITNIDEVLSPCKNMCATDVDNTYCIVCMRTVEEKKNWWKFSKEEKLNILTDLKTRKHK